VMLGEVICQVLCAGSPIIANWPCLLRHHTQWKCISMALSAFGNILLVSSACAVVLSVCIGVRSCGWLSSVSIWLIKMAVFVFMNMAPNYAFVADDMTA
jgi:hypothetical protein